MDDESRCVEDESNWEDEEVVRSRWVEEGGDESGCVEEVEWEEGEQQEKEEESTVMVLLKRKRNQV